MSLCSVVLSYLASAHLLVGKSIRSRVTCVWLLVAHLYFKGKVCKSTNYNYCCCASLLGAAGKGEELENSVQQTLQTRFANWQLTRTEKGKRKCHRKRVSLCKLPFHSFVFTVPNFLVPLPTGGTRWGRAPGTEVDLCRTFPPSNALLFKGQMPIEFNSFGCWLFWRKPLANQKSRRLCVRTTVYVWTQFIKNAFRP